MKCRICGNEMIIHDTVESCVVGHADVKNVPFMQETCSIDLFLCDNCGHVQIENLICDNYYNDYKGEKDNRSVYYSHSKAIYESRIKELYELNCGKSIIDIGCGTGSFLKCAEKFYEKQVGIEPSEGECKIAIEQGINVINNYFDDKLDIEEKFDAFACNAVLEHLEEPKEILIKAHSILNEGGVGLINIPDGEAIVKRGIYHQFISEHINYFSLISICKLVDECGFEVVKTERNNQLLELCIFVRKTDKNVKIGDRLKEHKDSLRQYLNGCNKIFAWGAGAKSGYYSPLLKDMAIVGVVDSDENKIGKYVSGIDIPVQKAKKETLMMSDAIVILASSYNNEIIAEIKQYGYKGKIIYFDHDENVVRMIQETDKNK